jgi:hypothetical protein
MSKARKINLQEDEEIIEVVHSTVLLLCVGYFFGLLFLLVTSFFLTYLLSFGQLGIIMVVGGVFLGLSIICRAWLKRKRNYWIVTNQRIVDIEKLGFFDEVVSEIWFGELANIFIRKKGIFANIFNYANVIMESDGEKFVLEVKKIRQPQIFKTWLLELKADFAEEKKMLDHKTILKEFIKTIAFLNETELDEVRVRIDDQLNILSEESQKKLKKKE